MNWYLIGFIIYGVLMALLGFWAARKVKGADDFMVAGRRMPIWLLAFTFAGLWFGGGTVIGTAGTTLDLGFWSTEWAWGIIPDPYGAGLCLILAGLFYFATIRRVGGITLADFFAGRFGKGSSLLSALLMLFAWVFFIAGEIAVIGKIFNSILGWNYSLSIIIGMALVMAYTIAGGLWSVAITNFVQMIIILVGITIALPISLNAVGGFAEVKAVVPAEMMSFFPHKMEGIGFFGRWVPWIAGWLIIGLGSIPSPDITQVAQSGASTKAVKRSAFIAGGMYWVFGTVIVLLGLIGFALLANGIIPEAALNEDPEMIIPIMIKELFPLPLGILFVSAILAGVMSCADGGILTISTLFTKNVIKDAIKPDIGDKQLLFWGRIIILIFAVLVVLVSIGFPFVFLLVMFGFDLLLAGLFIPLTLGIYWKKANQPGAIAGIIAGIFVRVVLSGILEGWGFETVMYPFAWYVYTLAAPGANLVVMIIVSLATQKSHPPKPLPAKDQEPEGIERRTEA
jgi:solute:Na+ symporter, SSS family